MCQPLSSAAKPATCIPDTPVGDDGILQAADVFLSNPAQSGPWLQGTADMLDELFGHMLAALRFGASQAACSTALDIAFDLHPSQPQVQSCFPLMPYQHLSWPSMCIMILAIYVQVTMSVMQ